MPGPVEIDPAESALSFFAHELRRLRTAAGLSQKQLADKIHFATSMIGMVETAARVPPEVLAKSCDEVLNGDGTLTRLWPLVNREAYPKNFRAYIDLERSATAIRSYEPFVVHGLVQTEAYARGILSRWHLNNVDSMVGSRLERQRILSCAEPTCFHLVLDEAALRRPVGGVDVMRGQLEYLLDVTQRPTMRLQVLPIDAPAHDELGGNLSLLSFRDGPDVASVDIYGENRLIGTAETVQRIRLSYDGACADALSPEASRDLIASLLEDPNPWGTRYRT